MNRTAVFSKTGKGLLEVKNRANKLTRDQYKVLGMVDGKASLDDLIDKARVPELELRKILTALTDGGYIKEFANASSEVGGATAPPSVSYVDDLDFTQILGPAKAGRPSVYTSGESERRQREEAERKTAEASATKAREEAERRAKDEAAARAAQAAAMKIREEAERRAQLEEERREDMAAQMRAKAEAEAKAKAEAERRAKEEVERKARIEMEVRARIEAERKAKEEALRKAREEEERRRKEEEEHKRREEIERKQREEAERRRKEEEERRRKEEEERRRVEEERRRKEDEERRSREEEERKRREEEERRRKEEEERKRREEEERKRREEEERRRKEEEERKRREEEERKRKEEEERRRKEEEERKRKEEEERKRKEEEERKRKEEEERRRKEEEERRRREEEERKRREEEERLRKEEEERRRKEEAERRLRALEEQHRREEEALRQRMEEQRRRIEAGELVDPEEEARKAREEEERRRREIEEERRRREEEERRWREEDERQRREDEERQRREQEERQRREAEERSRRAEEGRTRRAAVEAATVDFPSLDRVATPKAGPGPALSAGFEAQLVSVQSAEEQIEAELRLKEDAIRRQLEEQERRFRMEEEARVAVDRAEREAQEKADREAKELALAAERARKDAEQRSREEAARRAQEEKEKRARDQEERRKQAEEERKKRERERREAEQRSREEELARRRKEQEEGDRRKAELDRIQRESRTGRLGPGKIAAIAVVVLALLGFAAIELAPMSAYAPAIEKLASDRLGEPVRIRNVHMSVLQGFHIKLDNITVGVNQDVRIPTAFVYMDFGSLFADHKDVSQLKLESMTASQDALPRLRGWLAGSEGGGKVSVERVTLKAAKLEVPGLALPTFDAEIRLGPDGVRMATLNSTDGHLTVEITPGEQGVQVQAEGRNFVLPMSPGIEFADFKAEATASGNQLRVTQLTYSLFGGQGKATGTIGWGSAWIMDGEFEFQRMELETAMKAVHAAIPSEGTLDARGRLASQAASIDTLFDAARAEATFIVRKGNLSGLDLVRALQSPSRDGVTGGKTRFDEMSGNFSANGGRYQLNGVKLQAGAMNANGQADVSQDQDVSGRVYVELRSSATAIRGNFRILGTVKGMVLKQ